jgi:PHD/YefM family antitoxin component YafN of YafNO toxin-antitoxin module
MPITTISDEELERDPIGARKAADRGPVFIVEDGRKAFVLLSIKEYRKLLRSYKLALPRK